MLGRKWWSKNLNPKISWHCRCAKIFLCLGDLSWSSSYHFRRIRIKFFPHLRSAVHDLRLRKQEKDSSTSAIFPSFGRITNYIQCKYSKCREDRVFPVQNIDVKRTKVSLSLKCEFIVLFGIFLWRNKGGRQKHPILVFFFSFLGTLPSSQLFQSKFSSTYCLSKEISQLLLLISYNFQSYVVWCVCVEQRWARQLFLVRKSQGLFANMHVFHRCASPQIDN